MPSPRKRALRAACGNILSGEPSAAQIAYSTDWWNTVITEHSNNYASDSKPFVNGQEVLIGGSGDYDGLISGGEPGDDTSIGAYATITCADGDAASGMTEGQYVSITSANGTVRNYVLCTEGSTALNTGDQIAVGGDMGAGALPDSAPFNVATANNIVVKVTFSDKQSEILNAIRSAMNLTNGHNAGSANSVIQLSAALDTNTNGPMSMKLQNVVGGTAGNVTITTTISNLTIDGFTGGADALSAAVPHYWFDTTNASSAHATAADTLALTTATGVLYDPSGPNSQYIPSLETVSANTAKYVCIAPTGWGANDYITWELIGDTEASNDKLSLVGIDDGDNLAAMEGVKSDGTMEDVTDKHGTVAYSGRVKYEDGINNKGILVKFERDGTGADDSSMKKGWYFRWSYTAV